MSLEAYIEAYDIFMLLAGYVCLFLVFSFALALSVSAIRKLLSTIYCVCTCRFDELDDRIVNDQKEMA